ncbi:MAG: hypothetical protein ACLT0R_17540 [Paraclostridium sordellii]
MANEYKLKFHDAKAIRQSLSKVANMVVNGKLDAQRASSISTLCNSMLKAQKQLETEQEVEELKELVRDILNKDKGERK